MQFQPANREQSRAWLKAKTCINRGTKIPGPIVSKIGAAAIDAAKKALRDKRRAAMGGLAYS
jgi:hypothetical protein